MLRLLREREFPAREIVAFASERSVGRELDGGLVVRGLDDESIEGLRPRALLRRWLDLGRVGAALRRGRRGGRRQLLALAHAGRRPARRQRGQPRRARRPSRDHRQPELLDDADGRRAQAPPRRGRDRAPRDLHLPGGLRHRQGAPSTSCSISHMRCWPVRGRERSDCLPVRPSAQSPHLSPMPTRSPSTRCPTPARSPPAMTTPTRSAS